MFARTGKKFWIYSCFTGSGYFGMNPSISKRMVLFKSLIFFSFWLLNLKWNKEFSKNKKTEICEI